MEIRKVEIAKKSCKDVAEEDEATVTNEAKLSGTIDADLRAAATGVLFSPFFLSFLDSFQLAPSITTTTSTNEYRLSDICIECSFGHCKLSSEWPVRLFS